MANVSARSVFSAVLLLSAIAFAIEPLTHTVTHQELSLVISTFTLPWNDSKAYCEDIGMKLLSINSPEKDKILVDLFVNGGAGNETLRGNSWVSATEVVEGVWHWDSTEEPFYYTRWFVGQPDDTAALNCVYLANSALLYWRDANCSAPMYFICESSVH